MEINDTNYDIDNVDIEQEMEDMDIAMEIEANDEEREEIEAAEAEEKWKKQSAKITVKNLDGELLKDECDRRHYNIKYDGIKYTVVVLYKINDDNYLFTAKEAKTTEWKTIKMKLSDIRQ